MKVGHPDTGWSHRECDTRGVLNTEAPEDQSAESPEAGLTPRNGILCCGLSKPRDLDVETLDMRDEISGPLVLGPQI